MDFTYAPETLSGMILRISASNRLSIKYGSGSFFNLMARYPPISSLVGCKGGRFGYPGRYFFASSRMCGLPVMNRRTFGHPSIMCCKDFQRSGRCFAGNSSNASIQINPRRSDNRDLMRIAQISGSWCARPSTSLFALSKAFFISPGIGSTPATSCLRRDAKRLAADCSLCAWKSQYTQATTTLSLSDTAHSLSITRELMFPRSS